MDTLKSQYAAYEAARLAKTPEDRLQEEGHPVESARILIAQVDKLSGLQDQEVADALNAPDESLSQPLEISAREVSKRLLSSPSWDWARLAIAAQDPESPVRLQALTARQFIEASPDDIIPGDLLEILREAGIIRADLSATVSKSWAENTLGRAVTARDVGLARGAK